MLRLQKPDQLHIGYMLSQQSDTKYGISTPTAAAPQCAYVVLIRLLDHVDLPQKRFGASLGPGLYAYCGSAKGSGGLPARLRRHLANEKPSHWHVDCLTMAGEVVAIAVDINGDECSLCTRLTEVDGATIPVPGFGSSDCKICASHLIQLPEGFSLGVMGLTSYDEMIEGACPR